jgi:hypothetical protein
MKIITWNCNMAFRKKAGLILTYKPDILVIPECEHPDKLKFLPGIPEPADKLWFGTNLNKGLGIFSYSKFRFKLHKTYNPALKMVIPVAVTGGDFKLMLYAVWANNPDDPDGQYVEQVWKAIHHYDKHISNKQTKKVCIVVTIYTINKYREKKHIPHITYTGIRISHITSIIVLSQKTWRQELIQLRLATMIAGHSTVIMSP